MRRPFELLEKRAHVGQVDTGSEIQGASTNHEGRGNFSVLLSEAIAQQALNDLFEGPAGAAGCLLELRGQVVVER